MTPAAPELTNITNQTQHAGQQVKLIQTSAGGAVSPVPQWHLLDRTQTQIIPNLDYI